MPGDSKESRKNELRNLRARQIALHSDVAPDYVELSLDQTATQKTQKAKAKNKGLMERSHFKTFVKVPGFDDKH